MFPPKKAGAVVPTPRKGTSAELQMAQAKALRSKKPKAKRSVSGEFPAVQAGEDGNA